MEQEYNEFVIVGENFTAAEKAAEMPRVKVYADGTVELESALIHPDHLHGMVRLIKRVGWDRDQKQRAKESQYSLSEVEAYPANEPSTVLPG